MTNLDDGLRTMLAERAGDISTLPARLLDPAAAPARPATGRGRPVWQAPTRMLAAAAVAAIIVIAGAVVGLRSLVAGESGPPAAPVPSVATSTRSAAPSPSASPRVSTRPPSGTAACTTDLPGAWRDTLTSPGQAYGAQSAVPEAVTRDGDLLVARDFGHGGDRDLVLVRANKTPRQVFAVADPERIGIQNAYLDGDQLVVSVGSAPRAAKGTIPGSSPMPNVTHIYLVDLRSGARTQIAAAGEHRVIDSAALLDGKVYWDELPSYGARSGKIESYDLTTRSTRTAYSGPGASFYASSSVTAAGIYNGTRLVVRTALPAPVAAAVTAPYRANVRTDGTAYAWVAGPREIGWWTPAQRTPTYLRLPEALPQTSYPDLLLVAGHFVLIGGAQVLDTRTGAVAALPRSASTSTISGGAFGVFLGEHRVGEGRWQDGYWIDPQAHVVRVPTASLPDLRC